jgi:hypothetical protein
VNLDHHLQADIGIGEVANRVNQRSWRSRFHAAKIAQRRGLVKYIIALRSSKVNGESSSISIC